jgi:hypothetical protein
MTSRSVKFLSALPAGALLVLGAVTPVSPSHAAAGMAVGACVTIRQQPGPAQIIRVTPGGYVVQQEGKAESQAMNWQQDNVTPGPCPSAASTAALAAQPHACFASDADGKGATAHERAFRSVIRRTFEREAAPGMDGATTISFQSFKVGAPRRWLVSDGYNFTSNHQTPVYDLRVVFTTCVDYRTAIEIRRQERNFECFTAPTGETVCQVSGSTGGMAQDQKQYIPKR